MKTPSSGQTVFSLLRQFHEPSTVVHVGAGSGVGLLHQWRQWPVEQALLVDADSSRFDWVEAEAAGRYWQVVDACLTSAEGEQTFYQASNPDESGLVNPDQLKALWPNLHCTGQTSRATQRLEQILDQTISQEPFWLLIDCFPALEILQGAGETITRCGVLVVRVLQDTSDKSLAAASLPAISDFLITRGLRLVHVEAGTHPATAHAFFVHDWPAQLEETITEYDQLNKDAADLRRQLETLGKEKAEIAAERGAKFKEIEQLIQTSDALSAEKDSLQQQRNEQAKLAGERQAKLEAITAERDQVNKDANDLRRQLEALGKEKAKIAAERGAKVKEIEQLIQTSDALSAEKDNLQQQRNKLAKLADERQAKLDTITAERDQENKVAADLCRQLEALGKEKVKIAAERDAKVKEIEQLIQTSDALSAEKDSLQQQRDEQAKLVGERQAKLEAIITEHDQQKQQNNELQQQIEYSNNEKIALLAEKEIRINDLEAELNKTHHRQKLLDDEMLKAEAQIDLIKDVLLREPGL
jgi:hypothetical protein